MANRVYETMTLHRGPKYRVRVWREEGRFTMGPDVFVTEAIRCLSFDLLLEKEGPAKAADCLVRFCGNAVSAIEILDNEGNGAVYYPDWK